jgi:hypothetical protein
MRHSVPGPDCQRISAGVELGAIVVSGRAELNGGKRPTSETQSVKISVEKQCTSSNTDNPML